MRWNVCSRKRRSARGIAPMYTPTHRRETVRCTVKEFIDLWAQHIPQRYRHAVKYFGLFAPRRWAQVATAVFTILGTKQRPRPKRLPWVVAIQELGARTRSWTT